MAADGSANPAIDLPALVASTRHMPPGCSRPVISPNAFHEARKVLGAEIARVTGAPLHIAEIAAGGYLNTPDDPMASLGDIYAGRNGHELSAAVSVLRQWMAAPSPSFPRLALKPEPGERYEVRT